MTDDAARPVADDDAARPVADDEAARPVADDEAVAPPAEDEVLFAEAGAPWWPMLIGPVLAVGGVLIDRLEPGGATPWAWVVIGVLLFLPIALLVRTRRRLLRVRVSRAALEQGAETVPTADILGARPVDGSGRYGLRPLGGHPTVPRHLGVVVVTLADGSRRAAWARDADGLHAALSRVLSERAPSGPERS